MMESHTEESSFTDDRGPLTPNDTSAGTRTPQHRSNASLITPARAAGRIGEQLARGLGWFSVGLGVAEVVAPRALARAIGVNPPPALLRTMGMREIVSGLGILAHPASAGWMRTRVAGDALDLALLGAAHLSNTARKGRLSGATAAVLGVSALDVLCANELARDRGRAWMSVRAPRDIVVEKSVSVGRAPQECYQFWRSLENLPRFMKHLAAVRVIDERRSHWVVTAPASTTVEWDSEILEERPGDFISWRSLDGADVVNAGAVRFEPAAGRGTVVRVVLHYRPPMGRIGAAAAKLFGEEPSQQIAEDLRRFKQLLETGEIPTTQGQPTGRRSLAARAYRTLIRSDRYGRLS